VKTHKKLFNNYTQRKITVGKYVTCMLVNMYMNEVSIQIHIIYF